MKKTAMQLLLLKAELEGYNRPQWWWKEQVENLLETEREQIEEAYSDGFDFRNEMEVESSYLTDEHCRQYYKETYG